MSGPAHRESWLEEWFGNDERVIVANPDPALWPDKTTEEIPQTGDVTHTPGHVENTVDAATDAARAAVGKLDSTLTLVVLGLVAVAVIVVMK